MIIRELSRNTPWINFRIFEICEKTNTKLFPLFTYAVHSTQRLPVSDGQRVLLLNEMGSAGAAEDTGIKGKQVNGERLTAEQSVILKILANLGGRGVLETSQGDVRAELAVIRCQAKLKEAGGDLALQEVQWFAFLDPGPDDARLAAWGEEADPLQLQRKLRHRYLG